MVSEELSNTLLELYLKGATIEEIRRTQGALSLGQVVACRVVYDWDMRRAEYRDKLANDVPAAAAQQHLETVGFLGDMLTAMQKKYGEKIRQYLLTGDDKLLDGVPFPRNLKDLAALTDLFMKTTGQDKRRVEVSGQITHSHNGAIQPVSAKEASSVMDKLLGGSEVQDAEFTDVKPQ